MMFLKKMLRFFFAFCSMALPVIFVLDTLHGSGRFLLYGFIYGQGLQYDKICTQ